MPAAMVTLKYHLLSYVPHIKARLRVSGGKLQRVFQRVMPGFGLRSGAEKK